MLEVAILHIKAGQREAFEAAFHEAGQYIRAMEGYVGHSLRRCKEETDRYLLLVEWTPLEYHT